MAELRPYEQTWRDRLASMLLGDGRASLGAQQFVEGLLGSRGLGTTGMGLVDLTPAGIPMAAQEAQRDVNAGNYVGGILGATAVLPAAKVAAIPAKIAANEVAQGIRAYHGSPHSFDKFDMSKIGTGEGAQAYGHGLYFAENENIARSYRDALSAGNPEVAYEGKALPVYTGVGLPESGLKPELYYASMFGAAENPAFAREAHIKYLQGRKEAIPNRNDLPPSMKERFMQGIDEQISDIMSFDPSKIEKLKKGHMYEVNIRANPERFLDWDKPLSEQSNYVQNAISNFPHRGENWTFKDTIETLRAAPHMVDDASFNLTGNKIYNYLGKTNMAGNRAEGSREVSKQLIESGIPGIKYLDQGSRAAGEGSRNYVVFDQNIIDILRKYGLFPGIAVGGAAGGGLLGDNSGGQL
jgi:hypothetical protein